MNNVNSPGLDAYIQKGSEIDISTTRYVLIHSPERNSCFFEWFKFDTPACLLYTFVNLIDPSITSFKLSYFVNKNEQYPIEKDDKRKLKDIFNTHIAEIQLN